MNAIRKDIITSAIGILVLTLVLGIAYPLVVTGISQVAFPGNANGQKVYARRAPGRLEDHRPAVHRRRDQERQAAARQDGNPVTTPDKRYFQTRPSATVPADNPSATTFSNLGPNDLVTEQAIAANIKAYLQLERPYDPGLTVATIPVDAVDTSASGIDPDISPANADIQAHRVAAVRHLPLGTVIALVSTYTHGRGLGFSGEPGVNVLQLNLALDRATS